MERRRVGRVRGQSPSRQDRLATGLMRAAQAEPGAMAWPGAGARQMAETEAGAAVGEMRAGTLPMSLSGQAVSLESMLLELAILELAVEGVLIR